MLTTVKAPSDITATVTAANQPSWFIVTQVKSNRVVYFTDDPDYQPVMSGNWYFVSHYLGELPDEMSLRNCWGWRFNGHTFKDARQAEAPSPLESLLQSNRQALLTLLRDKINQSRLPLASQCALGDVLRAQKLQEARDYLRQSAPPPSAAHDTSDSEDEEIPFPLLRAVATPRNITMREAASLIQERDQKTRCLLAESEQLREHYTQAIMQAQDQEQLIQLRRELLDAVLPALTKKMVYPEYFFEPEDWNKPMPPTQRTHEVTRLQVQLRETINRRRARVQSQYLLEDTVLKHKARLAQLCLNNEGKKTEGVDFSLLQNFAQSRNLSLIEAARLILGTMQEAEQVLMRSEMIKDTMSARIESASTGADIRRLSLELEALEKTGRVPSDLSTEAL
ncbi:hypothetical protein RB25_11555 [Herbaspirillum rubrisubalbicans]|uniref:hypothetical protein n=1 Tax=Herbaspirillum rubrisubalbicans TaxID=80842 RepID=UPI000DC387BC|nr:hypothetical protein [Herbaspirillum rubrisubalbicans]RAN48420.1 hypothetical protein RB25_11555 [Herbaspirillum rubrisubalbicans]